MFDFIEKKFNTRDGLDLYYRDYSNLNAEGPPILCLSGTTQNSKVYEELALRLMRSHRVLCMDWRGHGASAHDPNWRHYSYQVDRDDVLELLSQEKTNQVIIVGTSLGGIITMHIALERSEILAGVIMNDVGPVIGVKGRQRLHNNMGKPMVFDSIQMAVQAMKERSEIGVTLTDEQWMIRARRVFVERDGKVVPDMDPMYGRVFRERKRPPDWWSAWDAMRDIPILAIRGAVSDILDESVLEEMASRHPRMQKVVVPGRGHCPHLDEPEALFAIDSFLDDLR